MENKLYKLLLYSTVGWEVVLSKLTREECKLAIEQNLAEGVNPKYIKVELDNSTD